MLDEKVKQAYRKFTPSSELEQRICGMQIVKKPKTATLLYSKSVLALAASVLLVLGSFTTVSYLKQLSSVHILLSDGTALLQEEMRLIPDHSVSALAAMPRMASETLEEDANSLPDVSFSFEISSDKAVSLAVEEGTLFIVNESEGETERVEVGQRLVCRDKGMTVCWSLPTSAQNRTYRMTIGTEEILLTYNAQTDEYTMIRNGTYR